MRGIQRRITQAARLERRDLKPGTWNLEPRTYLGLVVVLVTAVMIRLAFLSADPPLLLTTDSLTYALPANHLAHGQGFDLSLRRTPGYPLFLAALWAAFGDDAHPVVYTQHLLGIATAGLTWLLGLVALGPLAALLGGLAVALSGPQVVYEHYLMTESLFTFLLVLALLALVAALKRCSGRLYLLSGLCFALCALTRPVGQVFPLLIPLAVLLQRPSRGQLRPVARATLLALFGFGLVVLPWMVRNRVIGGELTGSSALGKTLFGRITRHDDGFRFDLPPAGPPETDPRRAAARSMARQAAQDDASRGSLVHERLVREFGYAEAQAYNVMRDVALEVLLAQPGYYVRSSLDGVGELFLAQDDPFRAHLERLASSRLRRDWQQRPELAAILPPPVPPEVRWQTLGGPGAAVRVYQPASGLLGPLQAGLFLAGTLAIALRPAWRPALALPLVVGTLLVLSAFLDGPVPRFRFPLDPAISLTAAAGLGGLVALLRSLALAAWLRRSGTPLMPRASAGGIPSGSGDAPPARAGGIR